MRPELLEKAGQCQNLRLHVFVQRVELRLKLIADINHPSHEENMTFETYDVNTIHAQWPACACNSALELRSKKLAHPILYRPGDRRAPYS